MRANNLWVMFCNLFTLQNCVCEGHERSVLYLTSTWHYDSRTIIQKPPQNLSQLKRNRCELKQSFQNVRLGEYHMCKVGGKLWCCGENKLLKKVRSENVFAVLK